jgi:uncharacterized protein
VSEKQSTEERGFAVVPELTDRNRHFWQGGAEGNLVFLRCQDCGYYLHPPVPICPLDQSKNVKPEAVSGRATVATFTINHHQWLPGFDPPYAVAMVEIVEQPALRLTTNVVNCALEDIHIGLAVQVVFHHIEDPKGDVWIPQFEPAEVPG